MLETGGLGCVVSKMKIIKNQVSQIRPEETVVKRYDSVSKELREL